MSGVYHKSADELQLLRRKLTQAQLPCHRSGAKDSVPDGSEEQAERLEEQLEQYQEILSEERILRKGNISVGSWNNDKKVAEVQISKGVHWQVFGKVVGGQLILQPEEALYMVDHGMLELCHCDLPMSIQQVYEMVLSDAFPLHHYVVYSKLRNLGFIVLQHEHHERKQEDLDAEQLLENIKEKNNELMDEEKDEKVEKTGEKIQETIDDTTKEGNVVGKMEGKIQETKGEENVERTEENIRETENVEEKVEMELKIQETLEEREVNVEKTEENIKETENTLKEEGNNVENVEEKVQMEGMIQEGMEEEKVEKMDDLKDSPVLHYWEDEQCQPLVHPTDSTSLESILNKLQIIKSQVDGVPTEVSEPEAESDRFKITYDIYQPQKKFKKSDPGLPNYSVCICKFSDPPPSIGEMNSLTSQSYPVPLKYAVVDCKDVSFYSFSDVRLPTYLES